MTTPARFLFLTLLVVSTAAGCRREPSSRKDSLVDGSPLVGAWRAKVVFRTGPLAEMKDLEFLYAYNAGGTMTESSNYDEAANSSPPAYGVWKQLDPHTFSTKYLFYTTQAPGPANPAANGRDWWPAGHGVLTETITLADDGQSYTSTITLTTYDKSGVPVASGGEGSGTGTGKRITF